VGVIDQFGLVRDLHLDMAGKAHLSDAKRFCHRQVRTGRKPEAGAGEMFGDRRIGGPGVGAGKPEFIVLARFQAVFKWENQPGNGLSGRCLHINGLHSRNHHAFVL
jgi:hypothetical protein